MRTVVIALIAAAALASWGQGAAPPAETQAPPPPPELTAAQISTAVGALPAPYNQGDYAAGRSVFAPCRSCHAIEASAGNRVGPNLHGLVGRHVGTEAGFSYSDALKKADFNWDGDHLDHWLAGPQAYLPGTRMIF